MQGSISSSISWWEHPATCSWWQGSVIDIRKIKKTVRDREGEVILGSDGTPLLIVNFGTRYKGIYPDKYVVETACHVPVDFIVFVKWETSEICFMTRQSGDLVEYQFVFLPASSCVEDFTVLSWSSDLPSLWDQLLSVLETQGPDMSLFKQGPWSLFGVTSKQVQGRISSKREKVSGILHCGGWDNVSTFVHCAEYLGVVASSTRFDWLVSEFMNEALPLGFVRQVSEQNVYWVVHNTTSTWKHPLYDKYTALLTAARARRVLSDWKSVTIFQLSFFHPREESLSSLLEICRIFKICVASELFLIPTIRRIFKHFSKVDEINLTTCSVAVDDFARIIDIERNLAFQKSEKNPIEDICDSCPLKATILCCDKFCQSCFDQVHSSGNRQFHQWRPIDVSHCGECEVSLANVYCVACKEKYCLSCFARAHARGKRQLHVSSCLPSPCPSSLMASPPSPWVQLVADGIPLFVNLVTREQRRDAPLS